jgi:hypothetical protein
MSERIAKLSGWVLGMLVVGAMVFGLSVVTAKPAYAMTCADNGWGPVGQQPNETTCHSVCVALHGEDDDYNWYPGTGCCVCLY